MDDLLQAQRITSWQRKDDAPKWRYYIVCPEISETPMEVRMNMSVSKKHFNSFLFLKKDLAISFEIEADGLDFLGTCGIGLAAKKTYNRCQLNQWFF